MKISNFILKIMAMPFEDKGRSYEGSDCYGVIYLGYRDVLGVELPKHTDEYEDAGDTPESRKNLSAVIGAHRRKWAQVEKPLPMDVVLFRIGGEPVHVGLMIDAKSFLHCERKRGSSIEAVDSMRWKLRKEGYFRLCQA